MAIGKLFDIQGGGTIVPKQDCYIIKPLKKVIDEFPEDHPKIFAWLHYMYSMRPDDNPYADVPLEQRSEQILFDLELDVDVDTPTIRAAMECVEEKYYTTLYGVYRGMKSMMDKIGFKLLESDINLEKDGNSMAISRILKEYEVYRKGYKTAFRDYDEEQGDVKVRGGGQLAIDEEDDY